MMSVGPCSYIKVPAKFSPHEKEKDGIMTWATIFTWGKVSKDFQGRTTANHTLACKLLPLC